MATLKLGSPARLLIFALVMLLAATSGLVATGWAQSNPVPFISQPLVPAGTVPGGSDFTLTVNGAGFASNAVVNWNGSPLTTIWVSSRQLLALVPAARISAPGTTWVTVSNPAPAGGSSNVIFFQVTKPSNALTFLEKDFALGYAAAGVAVADFNADGKLDIAVTNYVDEGWVDVLLGNGDGTFVLARTEGFFRPTQLAAGDFNGDGLPDLAVNASMPDYPQRQVYVVLGNGDGTFQAPQRSFADEDGFAGMSIGDFNDDGKLDIIATARSRYDDAWLTPLLGNGDGTFQRMSTTELQHPYPGSSVWNDFNNDGLLDVAVSTLDSGWQIGRAVDVLLGNGDSTFSHATVRGPFDDYVGIASADFNGDGKADLALSKKQGAIWVLLGNGDGTFRSQGTYATTSSPSTAAIGDFNGDGIVDMMVSNSNGTLFALLGKGDGTFQRQIILSASQLGGPLAGDFNGDGRLDLVTIKGNYVAVLLQSPITLSPASLTFPTMLVGTTSSSQTVTLTNKGTATLNISGISSSPDFLQKNNCGSSLAAGKSCGINIAFRPTKSGTLSGAVAITDDASTSPQTITLTGTGTVVSLSTPALDFGDQAVGTISASQQVTLTNVGTTALEISSIAINGYNADSFHEATTCGSILGPKSSCQIGVKFKPVSTGMLTANVEITDQGGASPQIVALSGNGT
jgi:hypothetical protein